MAISTSDTGFNYSSGFRGHRLFFNSDDDDGDIRLENYDEEESDDDDVGGGCVEGDDGTTASMCWMWAAFYWATPQQDPTSACRVYTASARLLQGCTKHEVIKQREA